MPDREIGFSPILPGDFRAPWFLDCAWGEYEKTNAATTLTVLSGSLHLKKLNLPNLARVRSVTADGAEIPFVLRDGALYLDATIHRQIVIV